MGFSQFSSISTAVVMFLIVSAGTPASARQLKRNGGGGGQVSPEYFEVPGLDDCENYCDGECDDDEIFFERGRGFRSCEFMEELCDCGFDTTLIVVVIICIALGIILLIFSGAYCCSMLSGLNCRKRSCSYSPILEANYQAVMNEEEGTVVMQVPSAPPPYRIADYGSCRNDLDGDAPPTYADVVTGRRPSLELYRAQKESTT